MKLTGWILLAMESSQAAILEMVSACGTKQIGKPLLRQCRQIEGDEEVAD